MDKNTQNERKIENLRLSNEEINQISRQSLREAMIYLVCEKGFKNVSITQLVKKAGVSRATFYRNYSSKEELMTEISKKTADEINNFLQGRVKEQTKSLFLDFFEISLKWRKIVQAIFKSNNFGNQVLTMPSQLTLFQNNGTEIDYYAALAFEGAFFNIYKDWVIGGFKQSPSVMANICNDLLIDKKYNIHKDSN